MKYLVLFVIIMLFCIRVFASVNVQLSNGVIMETSNGVSVELDGDYTFDESSYFCGEISSGNRSGCTSFSGLAFSSGFNGSITCHTGSEYDKNNGEPANFARWYELAASSDLNPVTMTITFVNNGDIDERNGLTDPETYYIMRYVNPWTKYAATLGINTLTATGVDIPVGASDWIMSNQDPIAVSLRSFNAVAENGAITIRWETAVEINSAGFNILRSREKDSDYQRVNEQLIAANGQLTVGAAYEYIDFPGVSAIYYYKLEDVSRDGRIRLSTPISVELVTGVLTRLAPPKNFFLCQNYPNPFNQTTTIKFGIPRDEFVQLVIYNIRGEAVRLLVDEYLLVGTYLLLWDGLDNYSFCVPTGVYFYKMGSGDFISSKKLTLAR
ncbi:T9SS type A sorting domain-containing protein [candidate division KSB1 bacterium]|nr:T9SS type A sorting domain-containing protein [candidate division KSB1 bacterium]